MSVALPELLQRFSSPLYVYDAELLRARCRAARAALPVENLQVLYAMKANSNPELLRIIREEGLLVDAVSIGEVECARRAGFEGHEISFTGNNVGVDELEAVVSRGAHVTVDSLSQLAAFGERFPGRSVGVRINPDVGGGHHRHVITGGPDSKFGIHESQVDAILDTAARHSLLIDGLHQHIGSGILDAEPFLFAMDVLLQRSGHFPELEFIDFGGGLGIPYRPGESGFDVPRFAEQAGAKLRAFAETRARPIRFRIEPGRFIVGECGTLLVTVTAVKRTPAHVFVGTDSGFNHLLRPTLYGSYHRIENLSRPDAEVVPVCVAGNVCESGDLFATDRPLPLPEEGDVLAIRDAGAYGWSMSSTYNLRPRPAEVLLEAGAPRLIRRRETLEDLLA